MRHLLLPRMKLLAAVLLALSRDTHSIPNGDHENTSTILSATTSSISVERNLKERCPNPTMPLETAPWISSPSATAVPTSGSPILRPLRIFSLPSILLKTFISIPKALAGTIPNINTHPTEKVQLLNSTEVAQMNFSRPLNGTERYWCGVPILFIFPCSFVENHAGSLVRPSRVFALPRLALKMLVSSLPVARAELKSTPNRLPATIGSSELAEGQDEDGSHIATDHIALGSAELSAGRKSFSVPRLLALPAVFVRSVLSSAIPQSKLEKTEELKSRNHVICYNAMDCEVVSAGSRSLSIPRFLALPATLIKGVLSSAILRSKPEKTEELSSRNHVICYNAMDCEVISAGSHSLSPPRIFSIPTALLQGLFLARKALATSISSVLDIRASLPEDANAKGLYPVMPYPKSSHSPIPVGLKRTQGGLSCVYDDQFHQFRSDCSAGPALFPPRILGFPFILLTMVGDVLAIPVQITQSWSAPDFELVRRTVGDLFASAAGEASMAMKELRSASADALEMRSRGSKLPIPSIFSSLTRFLLSIFAKLSSISCGALDEVKNGKGKNLAKNKIYAWIVVLAFAGLGAWGLLSGPGGDESIDYGVGWHEFGQRLGGLYHGEVL